ncbi:MAG TPA: arginine deiminase-related protein [Steroidobacteraceae bacterium]|jgi:hypothetical protein|nr:arginine deiminase-related protein [Steroidobacteraceae bacterium]
MSLIGEESSGAEAQSAAAVLMVRPAGFGFNPQTAQSNAFQQRPQAPAPAAATHATSEIQALALREFDGLADTLERSGMQVVAVPDTGEPCKPDAIFPNNWVSFHADGSVVLYPMLAPNRRLERREEVIEQVVAAGPFRATRSVDLSQRELEQRFLEGTGSLVLDRMHHVAYANLSPRTDLSVLGDFAQLLDYDLVTFESADGAGKPVYHTNVMMAIGTGFAVLCGESISDEPRRRAVRSTLESAGREIIEITLAQMHAFAGNVLELAPRRSRAIALSMSAWRSLDPAQRRALERHGQIVAADIPIIERYGGGSVRCMLAEIHLPHRLVS